MYMKVSAACGQNVIDDIANELYHSLYDGETGEGMSDEMQHRAWAAIYGNIQEAYHAGVDAAEDGSSCPECGEELEPDEEESSLEERKERVAWRTKEVPFSSESAIPECNLDNPFRYVVCANDGSGWINEAGFFDADFAIDFFQEYAAVMDDLIVRLYDRENLTCKEHNPFS